MSTQTYTCIDITCDGCHTNETIDQRRNPGKREYPSAWHHCIMGDNRAIYIKDDLHFCSIKCLIRYFQTGEI